MGNDQFLTELTAEMQMITSSMKMNQIRYHMVSCFESKGVTMGKFLTAYNMSYSMWNSRIFRNATLNLAHVNYVLKLMHYNYRLELINNEIHKVFQSKMNEI